MKVVLSKSFDKSMRKLSGKQLSSVQHAIQAVVDAKDIIEITDCKKLSGYNYIYRIRVGTYRAFFVFHVKIVNDVVLFEYLVPRGEAYSKHILVKLRDKDK